MYSFAMTPESLSAAKFRLLDRLKRRGESRVHDLARELELTEVAVRQHLQSLEESGLVVPVRQPPKGRGRPSILWSLSDKAGRLFPDHHAELAVGLLDATLESFGTRGLEQLLEARGRQQLHAYRKQIPAPGAPLGDRVVALAELRTQEGYMAEAIAGEDGAWLLVEHHCPICAAARRCRGLCHSELELFRQALGSDVEVERVRHLLAGGDRCTYRIAERSQPGPWVGSPR